MRHSLPAALVAILFTVQAAAQDDEDEANAEGEAAAGSLADGADPVEEETGVDGRFAPKGKTGKLKEKKKEEEEEKIAEIARKRINVFADIIGVWGVPPDPDHEPVDDGDAGEVTAYGLVVGGTYDLSPDFSLGLRIPFSRADFDVSEGRMANIPLEGTSNALGNPEVIGQYRMKRSPGVYLPLDFGIGLPVAQGDPDPTSVDHQAAAAAMVNRTMDAGTGWRDGELYYVGRVPIKIGIGYVRQRVSWQVRANTKLVAAPKMRGELNDDEVSDVVEIEGYSYNAVALRSVTSLGVSYNPWSGLWLGLDGWLVWDIIHELSRDSEATKPSKLQLAVEPMLGWNFDFMKLGLSYIKPLGGRLDALSGARLRAEFGF